MLFDYLGICVRKKRQDLKKLDQLVSVQSQVNSLGLEDKLGKQLFHQDMKKVFEPLTKSTKDVSDTKQ